MPKHPRLFRRGATYYHRAVVPQDLKATYPKTEETSSLKTTDYKEALKRVRIAAVEVDRRFEAHRRMLAESGTKPPLKELADSDIKRVADAYFANLLEEDKETRLQGLVDEWSSPHLDRTPRQRQEIGLALCPDLVLTGKLCWRC
ncbi:DUF6538 domain-containing protein [Nitratidesulfovibrio oxamicus]|uniref:DUF6538 domain-containing protein n=1 Tax=Nitratidesulfovibrio oxamicus TaxID=32016 RepID=UPI0027DC4E7A|nr:DUF6538 domain-containing protein [Nitratidesulfovibrio oxamicus]